MEIYCIEDFKVEFEKLKSHKSYKSIQSDLIGYFFNKPIQNLLSGTRLNNSDETPYIKKRLNGSGGLRLYFLVIIRDSCLYLMFVHPKTGKWGAENINDESKAYLYKKVLECIKKKDLYKLVLNPTQIELTFERVKPSL